jgi:hypothetical protein
MPTVLSSRSRYAACPFRRYFPADRPPVDPPNTENSGVRKALVGTQR